MYAGHVVNYHATPGTFFPYPMVDKLFEDEWEVDGTIRFWQLGPNVHDRMCGPFRASCSLVSGKRDSNLPPAGRPAVAWQVHQFKMGIPYTVNGPRATCP